MLIGEKMEETNKEKEVRENKNPIHQLGAEIKSEINEGKQEIELATKIQGADEKETWRGFLDQVHTQKLPSDKDFEWSDREKPGNSSCRLKDDASITLYSKSEQQYKEISGKEFNEHMKKTYGRDSVDYSGKEPDFSPFEQSFSSEKMNSYLKEKYGNDDHKIAADHPGHVEVSKITDDRRLTQSEASSIIADNLGISKSDLSDYMKANDLTWHECGDGKTVRSVPTEINSVYGHTGGIGIAKDSKAVGKVFREDSAKTAGTESGEISAKDWAEEHKTQITEARKEEAGKSIKEKNNAISKATNNKAEHKSPQVEKTNAISKAAKRNSETRSELRSHDNTRER